MPSLYRYIRHRYATTNQRLALEWDCTPNGVERVPTFFHHGINTTSVVPACTFLISYENTSPLYEPSAPAIFYP
jgi:hypothetical protein